MEPVTQSTLSKLSATAAATTANTVFSHGPRNFFSWYDYAIFSSMLLMSLGIGIYFGFCGKKQVTAKEYLMGGRSMKVIPVVISLVASHSSGITLLAVPADVYVFGAGYGLCSLSVILCIFIVNYIFLPVFYDLQVTSTYEYLGLRFDQRTRKCCSFMFALAVFAQIPVVIYVPALAFSTASGIDAHLATVVVCSICIFYTTIGGIKGLVWGDTIQFTLVFGTLSFILYLGIGDNKGIVAIWNAAVESERLDIFDLNFDITKRETFWAFLIAFTVHWGSQTAVNQGCNQKYLSVPTLQKGKLVVILYSLGMVVVKSISVFSGLLLSARYSHCDPFVTKQVNRNDELYPFYVLDITKYYPGISGLFIAGVFSASLSNLSANLNALSGSVYQDFLKEPLAKKGIKNVGVILKVLVVIFGILCTGMVYIIERLGGLLSLAIGLNSLAQGPLFGLFVLGFLFPRANKKGAFFGATIALSFMSVVVFGTNYYKSKKMVGYAHKPISVDSCNFFVNTTIAEEQIHKLTTDVGDGVFPLFKISFYWYTLLGTVITVVTGLLISYLTEVPKVPRKLLSPVIHRFLPNDQREDDELEYYGVEEALHKVRNGSDMQTEVVTEEKIKDYLRKMSCASDVFES